jgi:hydrogenase maturation protease
METVSMTTTVERVKRASPGGGARSGSRPSVDVLVCGTIERGDGGAPLAASMLLEAELIDNVRIQRIVQLEIDHLLAVRRQAGVVIVDAATGIEPGAIVELPLRGLLSPECAVHPQSSRALAMPEVIGLVDMLRGRPLVGRIVVIGARRFRVGSPITRHVAAAVPALARAIVVATEHVVETLREAGEAPARVAGSRSRK